MFILIQTITLFQITTSEMILVMFNNLQKLSKVSYNKEKGRDRKKEVGQKTSERMLLTHCWELTNLKTCIAHVFLLWSSLCIYKC